MDDPFADLAPVAAAAPAPAQQSTADPFADLAPVSSSPASSADPFADLAPSSSPVSSLPTAKETSSGGQTIKPTPTVLGEIQQGNFGHAAGMAFENTMRFLSPLTGPTKAQKIEDSVPFGTNADGTPNYQYKPLGDEISKRGLIPAITEAGSAALDVPTAIQLQQKRLPPTLSNVDAQRQQQLLTPVKDDSLLLASGKALYNTTLNLSHAIGNPAILALPQSRVIAGAFGAQMVGNAKDQIVSGLKADTVQGKIEGLLGGAVSLGMAAMGINHAAKAPSNGEIVQNIDKVPDEILHEAATAPQFKDSNPLVSEAAQQELVNRARDLADEIQPALKNLDGPTQDKVADILTKQANGDDLTPDERATLLTVRGYAATVRENQAQTEQFTGAAKSTPQQVSLPPESQSTQVEGGEPPLVQPAAIENNTQGVKQEPIPEQVTTPSNNSELFNQLQDKLSELQAEHDWQIEEGIDPQYLTGLRKTIGDVRKQVEQARRQRDAELLQSTDAPHAPIAGHITPPPPNDISPTGLGITPKLPPFLDKLTDMMTGVAEHPAMKDAATAFRGWLGGIAGKTFPKLTELSREAAEKGARWISSRIAAEPSARLFSDKVLEGTDIDPVKFGAALHEDNLRSVREGFRKSGDDEAANRVNTIIGGKGSPFKTEEDYQEFLKDPEVKRAIDRHKALWEQVVDPMYRNAMKLDPDEPLPERGLQTGARINLNPLREGESTPDKVYTVGRGNLMGTLTKKSPFGIQAKGTGEGYGMNYHDIMANTFGKQLEIANKNAFENELVKQGLAKIDQPGQQIEINGREAKSFPYKRQTLVTAEGNPISLNRSLYVDPRITKEYLIGSNASPSEFVGSHQNLFSKTIGRINQAALTGLTDATVHISNLASALLTRPAGSGGVVQDTLLSALGRADVPVTLVKSLIKGFQNNQAQFKELAEIGAMRAQHPPSTIPVLGKMSDLIQWADKTARLSLDDAFQRMAKSGLVENTETNRREFINQVGQYNKRAQGAFTRAARDTGLAPFVTAGKTFNALAVRTATMNPGVKAISLPSAFALRANVAAKWAGAVALVGAMNYLLTGKVAGRPGVPIGNIDTGKSDANNRPLSVPVFPIIGLGRAMRVTGARGALEATRGGLPTQDAINSGARDIANTALAPWIGPTAKFVSTSMGFAPGKDLPRPAPVVAPGENQVASDIGHAVINASPILGSIYDANKVGGSLQEALQRQLPRYLPQSGKPESMMQNYPEIVHKAQAAAFLNDVVGRARKLEPQARAAVIQDALQRLALEDRAHAIQTLRYRRVTP